MNFFRLQKPRGFQHVYLYVDERKERLKEIERRANVAARQDDGKSQSAFEAHFRESFRCTSKQYNKKRNSFSTGLLMTLFVVVFAFVVLWMLIEFKQMSL